MEEATAMQNLQPPRYKVAPAASGVSHPFQFGRGASAPAPAPVDTHEDSDAVISPGGTRSQERSSQVTFCKGGVTHNCCVFWQHDVYTLLVLRVARGKACLGNM